MERFVGNAGAVAPYIRMRAVGAGIVKGGEIGQA